MHGQFQLVHQSSQALESEQVGPAVFGMASLTQPIELTQLTWTQAFDSSAEVSLSQRFSSQAPAERSPKDIPGRRVR